MIAVALIGGAKIQGVITGEQLRSVHHQADLLALRQHLIQIHFEILVAQMDFHQIKVAYLGEHLDVVVSHWKPEGLAEAVGPGSCGGSFQVGGEEHFALSLGHRQPSSQQVS